MNSEAPAAELTTGMAHAVLREVADRLAHFVEAGEDAVIDLKSLPMTAGDLAELQKLLGIGEVRIRLEVAGRSTVFETSFPGVWWIRHRGRDQQLVAEVLEITRIPAVVCTHPDDAADGYRRLLARLEDQGASP